MKTSLGIQDVTDLIGDQFGTGEDVRQIVEGEESQAFSFTVCGTNYVIRINRHIEGFLKDGYAYERFRSIDLPIPRVARIGHIDSRRAFCISEMAPGITLQEADKATATSFAPALAALWSAMGQVDLTGSTGFGEFNHYGHASFPSWRNYILSVIDEDGFMRDAPDIDADLVGTLSERLIGWIDDCPEERKLVHGDFGSNNVLVDKEAYTITALLDWEEALYGDPLFDVANAYYWRTWLACMEASAEYWEAHLRTMTNYRQRVACYQLHIGLRELRKASLDGNILMLEWTQDRCRQLLHQEIGIGHG